MAQSSLKKNFIYNELYQILVIVIPLITAPYVTRVVGAEGLGIYSYTQSYANYFMLFIMLGVNNYGNREIARVRDNKEEVSKTFWEIYTLQFSMLIIVSLLYAILTSLTVHNNHSIYWLQFLYVMSGGFNINWCWFGLERFRLTVIRNSIIKISSAVLIFTLVKSPDDLWIYTLILTGTTLISQFVTWPFILKEISFYKPTPQAVLSRLKPNLVLFLPVIAVSLYNIMDKFMLGMIGATTEVAFYNYSSKLIEIPETFITAIGTIMLPRASNLISNGKEKERANLLNKSMQLVMLFSVASAFGISSIAHELVPWYYGSDFVRCIALSIALTPVIVFTSWNNVIRTQYVIPMSKDRIYLITVSSGAIVNLILNLILIPKYEGVGAVIGTLVAQFTVCLVQYFLTRDGVEFKLFLPDTFAFLGIGAIMYMVLIFVPDLRQSVLLSIALKIIIGVVVYASLSLVYLVRFRRDRFLINSILSVLPWRKHHD